MSVPTTETARDEAARQHLHTWLLAVGTGFVIILLGNWWGFGPWWMTVGMCLLMGLFLWLTRDVDVPPDTRGDAFYYLGFLFTLSAFIATLVTMDQGIAGSDATGLGSFLRNFGIAITTTIVGLAGRVYLSMSQVSAGDISREATDALAEAVQRFKASLADAQDKMDVVVARVGQSGDRLGETTDAIADVVRRAAEISRSMHSQAESIASLGGDFESRSGRVVDAMDGTATSFRRVKTLLGGLEDGAGRLSSGLIEVSNRLSEVNNTLAAVHVAAGPTANAMNETRVGLADGAARAASLAPALEALHDSMRQAGEAIKGGAAHVSASLRRVADSVEDDAVSAALLEVPAALSEVAARTSEVGPGFGALGARANGLGATLQGLDDSAVEATGALTRVSEVVRRVDRRVADEGAEFSSVLKAGAAMQRDSLAQLSEQTAALSNNLENVTATLQRLEAMAESPSSGPTDGDGRGGPAVRSSLWRLTGIPALRRRLTRNRPEGVPDATSAES